MIALLRFLLSMLTVPFKPMWRLETENAALRQQLIVFRRNMKGRPRSTNGDRINGFRRHWAWSRSSAQRL